MMNYLYYYKIVLQGLRRNLSTTRRRGHGDDDEAGLEMRIHLRPKFLQVKKITTFVNKLDHLTTIINIVYTNCQTLAITGKNVMKYNYKYLKEKVLS